MDQAFDKSHLQPHARLLGRKHPQGITRQETAKSDPGNRTTTMKPFHQRIHSHALKHAHTCRLGLGALLLGSTGLAATSFTDALTQGKPSLQVRARYEHVEQDGLRDADALTFRTRLGYTSGIFEGFQASVEAENITALDGDSYSQAGLNPAAATRAVVADPETTEINQAWVSWRPDKAFGAKAGRQRIVHDQARFVGDVGWRQNMQTFDAIVLDAIPAKATTLSYSYVDRVNRVFGDKHAQGNWNSDSHLIHATHAGSPLGKFSAYAYLLDFDNARANSSATYGLSYTGEAKVDAGKLTLRAEAARQTDYGLQPLNYSANYWMAEAGLNQGLWQVGGGYEVLGSDGGRKGFATPLATLHAYNGWADVFLATPASGLRDLYAWIGGMLPGDVNTRVTWHRFEADRGGSRMGDEWDAQAGRAFGKNWNALAKVAFFDGRGALPDVSKYWLQVEFSF